MEIDLRQLRGFEVLLRERNLTQAAVVLGLSQPALKRIDFESGVNWKRPFS